MFSTLGLVRSFKIACFLIPGKGEKPKIDRMGIKALRKHEKGPKIVIILN